MECGQWDSRQRTVGRQQQCAATVDSGSHGKGRAVERDTGSKESENAREITMESEKEKREKVGGGIRKERERANVFKACADATSGTILMCTTVCQSYR